MSKLITNFSQSTLVALRLKSRFPKMLTQELKSSFKLQRTLFGFLPDFLVRWDHKFEKVSVNRSYISWVVWILGMLDGLLVAAGNLYVVLSHFLLKERPNFHLTTALIFVAGSVAVGVVWVVSLIALQHVNDFIAAFNQTQSLASRMIKRNYPSLYI